MTMATKQAELTAALTAMGPLFDVSWGKLLWAWAEQYDLLDGILAEMAGCHNVATATGHSLDLIGQGLRFPREADETDQSYRLRLQLEIDIRSSQGTLEEIRDLLARYLQIDPATILLYQNKAPSLGLIDLPYFVEVSLNWKRLKAELSSGLFKFSDNPTVSTFSSSKGFDTGAWERVATVTTLPSVIIVAILERILSTGVQYVIAVHGGFKFADHPTTSTHASARGFDTGRLRKTVVV